MFVCVLVSLLQVGYTSKNEDLVFSLSILAGASVNNSTINLFTVYSG